MFSIEGDLESLKESITNFDKLGIGSEFLVKGGLGGNLEIGLSSVLNLSLEDGIAVKGGLVGGKNEEISGGNSKDILTYVGVKTLEYVALEHMMGKMKPICFPSLILQLVNNELLQLLNVEVEEENFSGLLGEISAEAGGNIGVEGGEVGVIGGEGGIFISSVVTGTGKVYIKNNSIHKIGFDIEIPLIGLHKIKDLGLKI
jgi:hypothetical protein